MVSRHSKKFRPLGAMVKSESTYLPYMDMDIFYDLHEQHAHIDIGLFKIYYSVLN